MDQINHEIDVNNENVKNAKDFSASISKKSLKERIQEAKKRYESASKQPGQAKDGLSVASALGELHSSQVELKRLKDLKAQYEEIYFDFKENTAKNYIKDVYKLVDGLMQPKYSQEDRSLMMEIHLEDVEKMDAEQHKQFLELQQAFVIARSRDFNEKLKQIKSLTPHQIQKIVIAGEKRYHTDLEDRFEKISEEEDRSVFISKTKVHGHTEHCYETHICPLQDSDSRDLSIDIVRCYKRRPLVSQADKDQDALSKEGLYDDEAEPIINSKRKIDTKPLSHSHILIMQIEALKKLGKLQSETPFDLGDIHDDKVIERETVRTLMLFMEGQPSREFKKGDLGYEAAKGTPMGKVKWILDKEYFSGSGFDEVEVSLSEDKTKLREISYVKYAE